MTLPSETRHLALPPMSGVRNQLTPLPAPSTIDHYLWQDIL